MDDQAEAAITPKKTISACDIEALKKWLEENKGDYFKCQSQIEAVKSSCSIKKPTQSLESAPNPNNKLASSGSLVKAFGADFDFGVWGSIAHVF